MNDDMRKLVDEAEERAKKATPGPWKVWGMQVMADPKGTSNVEDRIPVADTHFVDTGGFARTFDADFIANAKQDVPALCAAVRELDAENARLKSDLKRATTYGPTDYIDIR